MDYNAIYNKLNLREIKKRKANGSSTSREELPQAKQDINWLENLMDDEEEALAPPHEEETQLPPLAQPRNLWTILDNHSPRVDHDS